MPADLDDLKRAITNPTTARPVMMTGIFVLACLYTVYFAREFLLPVVVAFVFHFLLWPIVRGLARLHVPEPLGAGLVLAAAFAIAGLTVYELAGPVGEWLDRAPELAQKIQREVRHVKAPVEQVTKATERITNSAPGTQQNAVVEIRKPSLAQRLFVHTWDTPI